MEKFMLKYNVSRETYCLLESYVALLCEWQKKFNLVSNNSLPFVWERHVEDSAQLFKYLSDNVKRVYDFGSGAGFPALVLAIMAKEKRSGIKFKLVESITKKTLYLNAVKSALGLDNVEILNCRVESLKLSPADVITARAMTALDGLLEYSLPFCSKETKLIFPKGQSYEEELSKAKQKWNFKLKVEKNEISENGVILLLENLRRKK